MIYTYEAIRKMFTDNNDENKNSFDIEDDEVLIDDKPKRRPKPADPIKDINQIKAMQEYLLNRYSYKEWLLFTVGVTVGLRISDLLSLKFSQVYYSNVEVKDYIEVYEKKTDKYNKIMLNEKCKQAFKGYLSWLKENKIDCDYEYIFIGRSRTKEGYQKPLSTAYINNILKDAAKAVGLEGNISTHTMRKTFVYHSIKMSSGDWDALFTIQNMLNHTSFQTTLRYCGLDHDKADSIREKLNNIIG